ncbi:MAG: hypothetical protein CM1200mP28_06270 [Deltaproteobacteria bacterium]|nr:MAG: hypothetical protein CM1200mP28_06270 [Deltaproteobacteria bacterium]
MPNLAIQLFDINKNFGTVFCQQKCFSYGKVRKPFMELLEKTVQEKQPFKECSLWILPREIQDR